MKLSFIIPAFNEESYLGDCLQSILTEAKKAPCEVEIVVVDNASTDNTKQVALAFKEVKVVEEPRKGLSYARQAGYLASSGEIIANIDADSTLDSGWISTILKRFQKNNRLIALSGPVVYHDLPISSNVLIRIYYYAAYVSYLLNRFIFRASSLIQGGNFVVRRSALQKIGGYNTDFKFYGEDTDIARRLRPLGPVVFSFAIPIYTSGRRLKAEGFIKMGWKYPINYFWTSFFKRPFHNDHVDIRSAQPQQPMRTTIKKLKRVMDIMELSLAFFLVIILSVGFYVSIQLSKLGNPTPAQAEQSKSYVIREFGPEVLKLGASAHSWGFDRDGITQQSPTTHHGKRHIFNL